MLLSNIKKVMDIETAERFDLIELGNKDGNTYAIVQNSKGRRSCRQDTDKLQVIPTFTMDFSSIERRVLAHHAKNPRQEAMTSIFTNLYGPCSCINLRCVTCVRRHPLAPDGREGHSWCPSKQRYVEWTESACDKFVCCSCGKKYNDIRGGNNGSNTETPR